MFCSDLRDWFKNKSDVSKEIRVDSGSLQDETFRLPSSKLMFFPQRTRLPSSVPYFFTSRVVSAFSVLSYTFLFPSSSPSVLVSGPKSLSHRPLDHLSGTETLLGKEVFYRQVGMRSQSVVTLPSVP